MTKILPYELNALALRFCNYRLFISTHKFTLISYSVFKYMQGLFTPTRPVSMRSWMHARNRAGSYGSAFPRLFVSDPQPLSMRSFLLVEELFFVLAVFMTSVWSSTPLNIVLKRGFYRTIFLNVQLVSFSHLLGHSHILFFLTRKSNG